MDADKIAKLAEILDTARRSAKPLTSLDEGLKPATLDDGFAVQAAIAKRHGGAVNGWKIMGGTPESLVALRVPRPLPAPIFKIFSWENPAKLDAANFVGPKLECEIAYLLAKDLPPRSTPYTQAEVEDAIGGVMAGVEVVDSRLTEAVRSQPMVVADCVGNGGYVTGKLHRDWRKVDLTDTPVTVTADGKEFAKGSTKIIPTMVVMVSMANNQAPGAAPLKAGQFVTTGTLTGAPVIGDARKLTCDFGPIGTIELEFKR